MTGEEFGLIVCNHKTASQLIEKHPGSDDIFVITEMLSDDSCVIVSKLDFVNWLCGENDAFK